MIHAICELSTTSPVASSRKRRYFNLTLSGLASAGSNLFRSTRTVDCISSVAETVGPSLDHPDLGAQFLDIAERDFVLWETVGGESLPMPLDHLDEVLVRFETLPLERRFPVLEEVPGPAFGRVVPDLAEGLLQDIGRVESLVRLQGGPQGLPPGQGQVLPV